MGPNLVILASHKIHFTLKKKPIHAILAYQIEPTSEKGPIHAIPTHQMQPTLEKGSHQCDTYISNVTYTRKKDPNMQYLHIKCNLHWKREPINSIPTY
jgi:hypothetical protein